MKGIPEDWEVVGRETNHPWITTFFVFILGLISFDPTGLHSSVTWTVRQKSTGIVKRVTARSETEAADKIAKGWFDADQAVVE
jgi:hypothetical protein